MKAMILREARPIEEHPLEAVEMPAPTPGPDEIRIKVRACGVCHTDLHTVEGELALPKLPIIPGHQIVGVVDQLGTNVTRFRLGDRVGVAWLYSSCGQCNFCRQAADAADAAGARENLCDQARFTGLHADGGYAQYTVVLAAFAYAIPPGFPDLEAAPLLCAGVIGYRSLRLSEILPGERLGLYGFGASAHVTIQVARHWGCEVFVFTRSEEHRQLALELGATWVGGARDEPPGLLDSAITFAPAGWIVPEALRVLRKGGTVTINAIHMSPIPEMKYSLIYHERTLRSVANMTRQDAEELLQLAAQIPIHTEVEVYPLAEANRVLQRLKDRQVRGAAVLEVPE